MTGINIGQSFARQLLSVEVLLLYQSPSFAASAKRAA